MHFKTEIAKLAMSFVGKGVVSIFLYLFLVCVVVLRMGTEYETHVGLETSISQLPSNSNPM